LLFSPQGAVADFFAGSHRSIYYETSAKVAFGCSGGLWPPWLARNHHSSALTERRYRALAEVSLY